MTLRTTLLSVLASVSAALAFAAPIPNLWPCWQFANEVNPSLIDHSDWQALLDRYLVFTTPDCMNRFRYWQVEAGSMPIWSVSQQTTRARIDATSRWSAGLIYTTHSPCASCSTIPTSRRFCAWDRT